jgi:hypothetical protein
MPVSIACQEGEAMELRVHPKMKWEGYSNWPPAWGVAYRGGDIFPSGEYGALKSVAIREGDDKMPIHLELTIEHSGKTASGILCCDDAAVIPCLYEVFSRCIGESIRKIGDLEVDL